jgi:hypothetical protein
MAVPTETGGDTQAGLEVDYLRPELDLGNIGDMRKLAGLGFAVLVLAIGCKDQAQEEALAKAQAASSAASAEVARLQMAANASTAQAAAAASAAQAVQNAGEQKKAIEKIALISTPEKYLETSDYQNTTKGIVNSYGQLVGVTVRNRSHFSVQDLTGNATWSDKRGSALGSVPFTLKGSIPAGATQPFSIKAGTLTSGPPLQGAVMPPVVKLTLTAANVID